MKGIHRVLIPTTIFIVLFVVVFIISLGISNKRNIADALENNKKNTTINRTLNNWKKETKKKIKKSKKSTETKKKVAYKTENNSKNKSKTKATDTQQKYKKAHIGEFRITWYSAEELIKQGYGSPDGHTTASGRWAQENHTIAMNYDQRKTLGISYGTRVLIDGMGEFVVEDCGCSWGTIDMFFEYNPSDQEWSDNPYRDVWIVG